MKQKSKSSKKRAKQLHQYYNYTGFYKFVWASVKKVLPYIILILITIFIVNNYYDLNSKLTHFTEILPIYGVLIFFFISETLLGLVPPEIFIAWAGKTGEKWLYLSLLGFLSYFGGLISYWIGVSITKAPRIHVYLETKMKKQLKNSKKWGGFLIVVGALLPLPFSIACIAAGIIHFPFKNVVLFGSLRLLRFLIYGVLIFSVV